MAIGTPTYGNGGGASAAASFNVSFPSSISAGDLLVLACYTRSNASTWTCFTIPASFTGTIRSATATANGSYAIFYKVATGSESGTLSVTGSTSNNTEVAKIVCIPGAGTSFTAGSAETEAAGTTFTNSGVTPAVDGSMVVLVTGFQDHGTTTGDTGFSNWTGGTGLGTWTGSAYGTTSGTDGTIGIGCALQSTAQATGNISVDHTDETNDAGISYSFAVAPAPYSGERTESATATDTVEAFEGTTGSLSESTTATDSVASAKTSPAAALAIESGFPVSTNISGTPRATVTATVTTASASVLVVVIGGVSADSSAFPLASMEGASLTWTKVTAASSNQLSGSEGHEVWYAVSSGSISSQVITATVGGSRTLYTGIMSVYSFTGADTTTVVGGSGTRIYNTTPAVAVNTTLTATAASNIVALINWRKDSSTALTAEAFNSPYDASYQDLGNSAWFGAGHGDTTGSGSTTFGSSTTSTRHGVGGVEILAGAGESSPYGRTQTESSTASDSTAAALAVQADRSEPTTATDSVAASRGTTGDRTESATATDSVAASRGTTGARTESVTATDSAEANRGTTGARSESTTATDDVAALTSIPATLSESATASDDVTSSLTTGGTVHTGEQSEPATASDASAAMQAVASSRSDAATATDSTDSRIGATASRSESATATDSAGASQVVTASLLETITATETYDDALASAGTYTGALAETATATDAWGVAQVYAATQLEAVTAADSYVGQLPTTYDGAVTESITATDGYSASAIAAISQRLRVWNGASWV